MATDWSREQVFQDRLQSIGVEAGIPMPGKALGQLVALTKVPWSESALASGPIDIAVGGRDLGPNSACWKHWPVFVTTLQNLGLKVAVVGQEELELGARAHVGAWKHSKGPLVGSVEILQNCRLYVGTESNLSRIACALMIPTLIIDGRPGPAGQSIRSMERENRTYFRRVGYGGPQDIEHVLGSIIRCLMERPVFPLDQAPRRASVILTSCLRPTLPVMISDPDIRMFELICSIISWLRNPAVEALYVGDNSNHAPPLERLCAISEQLGKGLKFFPFAAVARSKGHGEGQIIAHVIEKCPELPATFWKMTGRLYISDFERLNAESGACDNLMGWQSSDWRDTRLFKSSQRFFRETLLPAFNTAEEIGENVEKNCFRALAELMVPGPHRAPSYVGRSGGSGELYGRYPSDVVDEARSIMEIRVETDVSLSVLVTTTGRPTLINTLRSLRQLRERDEVLVVSDGEFPNLHEVIASVQLKASVRTFEHLPPARDWANTLRNVYAREATKDFVLFMDDDDCYAPGALEVVRSRAGANRGSLLIFRMRRAHDFIPHTLGELMERNISTQCGVVPNTPHLWGQWASKYSGDYEFFRSCKLTPIWFEEVICYYRPNEQPGLPAEVREMISK
jgi:hypothetical protein